jgi:hypothetical protein
VFVDPAGTLLIEKGTPALWVGIAAQEQVGVIAPNVPRFDLEHSEIVYAALMASSAAMDTFRMDGEERQDPLVHLLIDTAQLAR